MAAKDVADGTIIAEAAETVVNAMTEAIMIIALPLKRLAEKRRQKENQKRMMRLQQRKPASQSNADALRPAGKPLQAETKRPQRKLKSKQR